MPPDPPFTVTARTENGTQIITLTGELDITFRDTLAEQLSHAHGQAPEPIAYDLTKVPYIDAGTAHLLLSFARHPAHRPVLICPAPAVTRLLQVTGLDTECTVTQQRSPAPPADAHNTDDA